MDKLDYTKEYKDLYLPNAKYQKVANGHFFTALNPGFHE